MTENIVSLDTLCRACLKPTPSKYTLAGKLKNLKVTIADMLEFCTSKKIHNSEDLPENVCTFCYNTIRIAYEFFKQFKNVQEQLNALKQNIDQVENDFGDHSYEPESSEHVLHAVESIQDASEPIFEEIFIDEANEADFLDIKIEPECDEEGEMETIVTNSNRDMSDIEPTVLLKNRENRDEKLFPYICPLCTTKYSHIEQFHRHILQHNCGTVVCLRCQAKPEYNINEYIEHYKEYHKLQCDICNKKMASAFGYKYHMKTHISMNGYKCPVKDCCRSFLFRHLLRKHIKNHYQPTVYSCNLCSSTFNNRDTLRYHLKKHSNKKDHLCTICGRAFYLAGHLTDHMNRHSDFKRFGCNICNKKFTTSAGLKKHIRLCAKKKHFKKEDDLEKYL